MDKQTIIDNALKEYRAGNITLDDYIKVVKGNIQDVGQTDEKNQKDYSFEYPNISKKYNIEPIPSYNETEIYNLIYSYLRETLELNDMMDLGIVGMQLVGSRVKGYAKKNSDLDCLIEYDNDDYREDTVFNVLNEDPLQIGNIIVDFNPICKNRSGYTIQDWLDENDDYNKYEEVKSMKNITVDDVINFIESNTDFSAKNIGKDILYGQGTPCNEDWEEYASFSDVNNGQEAIDNIIERAQKFNVKDEASVYIAMRGTHGVPSSANDLLEDAQWKKDQLSELAATLNTWVANGAHLDETKSNTTETIEKLEEESELDVEAFNEHLDDIASVSPLHKAIIEDIKLGARDYENESIEQNIIDYCKAVWDDPNEINMNNLMETYNHYADDIYNFIEEEIFQGVDVLQRMAGDDQLSKADVVLGTDSAKVWVLEFIYKQIASNVSDY